MEAGEAIAGEQRSTSRMPEGVPNSAVMYGIRARRLAIAERQKQLAEKLRADEATTARHAPQAARSSCSSRPPRHAASRARRPD